MAAADQKPFQIRLSGTLPQVPGKGGSGASKKKEKLEKNEQQKQQRHIVTVAPLMTMEELNSVALARFSLCEKKVRYGVEFWTGFPPKKLALARSGVDVDVDVNVDGLQECSQVFVKDWIRGGENVIVKFVPKGDDDARPKPVASKTKSKKGNSKKRPRNAGVNIQTVDGAQRPEQNGESIAIETKPFSCPEETRPKRAAARAATEAFSDTIRAQEQLLRSEKKRSVTKSRKNTAKSISQAEAAKKAAATRAANARSNRLASLPGRRLADGAHTVQTTNSTAARKSKQSFLGGAMSSEDDVSTTLLSSLSSSDHKNNKVGKFLRSAMRNAVGKTYEASRAVVRNSAITSKDVTFTHMDKNDQNHFKTKLETSGENDQETHFLRYKVKYPKGMEGRGYYEEEVEIITEDALKAVIRAVHADSDMDDEDGASGGGREMLRSRNMAQLSPRVFWSLWFLYKDDESCTCLDDALKRILPDLDWSFLDVGRSRVLSEKARENLRQERESQGLISDGMELHKEYKTGKEVVEAVEDAMEKLRKYDVDNARERAARAALTRFGGMDNKEGIDSNPQDIEVGSNGGVAWNLVTPTELDLDELKECIEEGMEVTSRGENAVTSQISETLFQEFIRMLINQCSIHNWRELANAEASKLFAIFSKYKQLNGHSPILSEQIIDSWIEAAQSRTIEEIMLEILDGKEDVLIVLREEARAGTPKDLSLWSSMTSMLLEEAPSLLKGDNVTVEKDVDRWCKRASIALDTLEWLSWYATPVA